MKRVALIALVVTAVVLAQSPSRNNAAAADATQPGVDGYNLTDHWLWYGSVVQYREATIYFRLGVTPGGRFVAQWVCGTVGLQNGAQPADTFSNLSDANRVWEFWRAGTPTERMTVQTYPVGGGDTGWERCGYHIYAAPGNTGTFSVDRVEVEFERRDTPAPPSGFTPAPTAGYSGPPTPAPTATPEICWDELPPDVYGPPTPVDCDADPDGEPGSSEDNPLTCTLQANVDHDCETDTFDVPRPATVRFHMRMTIPGTYIVNSMSQRIRVGSTNALLTGCTAAHENHPPYMETANFTNCHWAQSSNDFNVYYAVVERIIDDSGESGVDGAPGYTSPLEMYAQIGGGVGSNPTVFNEVWYEVVEYGSGAPTPTPAPSATAPQSAPPSYSPPPSPPDSDDDGLPDGQVDICPPGSRIVACIEAKPYAPGFNDGVPGGGMNDPGPIADCSPTPASEKPGYIPYSSVGVDGATDVLDWIGKGIGSVPAAVANTAKWAWNSSVNGAIPGECVGVRFEQFSDTMSNRAPFAWAAEVTTAVTAVVDDPEGGGSLPESFVYDLGWLGTVTVPLEVVEWMGPLIDLRPVLVIGVLVGFVWVMRDKITGLLRRG